MKKKIHPLYKYTDLIGVKKILGSRSLKFSSPSAFNDPFDMQIRDILGSDMKSFLSELRYPLFEKLSSEIDFSTMQKTPLNEKMKFLNMAFRNNSPEKKKILQEILEKDRIEDIYDLPAMERKIEDFIYELRNTMDRHGVLCTSIRSDNTLMWTHYAESHRGAVLKFIPSEEKNSVLLASKPVNYLKNRPILYPTPEELVNTHLNTPYDHAKKAIEKFTFTKSKEWEYEQEYRLAIPNELSAGQTSKNLKFYSEELAALYLGCRMPEKDRTEIIIKALQINPNISIFEAQPCKREYTLNFLPIQIPILVS